jgi:hypothetical protein
LDALVLMAHVAKWFLRVLTQAQVAEDEKHNNHHADNVEKIISRHILLSLSFAEKIV